jgi:hypothetical protein
MQITFGCQERTFPGKDLDSRQADGYYNVTSKSLSCRTEWGVGELEAEESEIREQACERLFSCISREPFANIGREIYS